MSGVDLEPPSGGRASCAASARAPSTRSSSFVEEQGGTVPDRAPEGIVRRHQPRCGEAPRWRWPTGSACSALVHLKDVVKGGIKSASIELRRMGIRTVMITGDNQLTAAAIAAESGVDDFLAEATPEAKLEAHPRLPGEAGASWR